MTVPLKILGIHGLGDHRQSSWKRDWQDALRAVLPVVEATQLVCRFFEYDRFFNDVDVTFAQSLSALYKLVGSGLTQWLDQPAQEGRFGAARREGIFEAARDRIRWTAGYVVAWIENEEFRALLRNEFLATVARERPNIILAHSLGSLIGYDALLSRDLTTDAPLRDHLREQVTFISLGSQIANPFIVGNLTGGRVMPLPVDFWFHLYNSEDDVFTAPISLPGVPNFRQVNTWFDIEGMADHDPVEYLKHSATVRNVWSTVLPTHSRAPGAAGSAAKEDRAQLAEDTVWRRRTTARHQRQRRKALLVGICEYADPRNRLAGCVNDVFLMSALLQENGFRADDIRIVLNQRATAAGIRSRLQWLTEEALPGDQLVFYFSGHGAQMPAYDATEVVDHFDEALVPYDFDWSPERAIIDDQICQLYSQLHFDTRLTMIFDCCHSGGLHRDGGPTIRGISPPDDIRHRALKWDASREIWVPRAFAEVPDDESPASSAWWEDLRVRRLGRASQLRTAASLDPGKYEQNRRLAESLGEDNFGGTVSYAPYLPLILEACRENEFAYEYRHGAESYGAFTYMLSKRIRRREPSLRRVDVTQVLTAVTADLRAAGHAQSPQLCGPPQRPDLF